jgi:uncharacterized protein (TIGR03437 family)
MLRLPVYLILLATVGLLNARSREADYALVLEDDPVAQSLASREALRAPETRARITRVLAAQKSVREALAARRIAVDTAVQVLANAIFVTVPGDRADELRTIPGVKRVQRLPRLKRNLDRALDIVRATQAWTNGGGVGNAGAGVKIGIIDSGVDKDHPGFQDNSLTIPSGFPKGDLDYTSRKIIVARSYMTLLTAEADEIDRTHPDDPTPRDSVGHGTAIAMIAAGVRNNGPAGVIQGVAPKAWLGNYKIFGSPGVNDFTKYALLARALEDAYNDGMDIVTLALGEGDPALDGPLDRETYCSSDGSLADCDVRAQAVELASRRGMLVVAAAGNGGDIGLNYPTISSIDTPGTAPSALTVGATTNSHILFAGVTPQGGARMYAIMGAGARMSAPLTAPLKEVGGDGLACAPLAAGSLAGAVALIQRGTCVLGDKITIAQTAGAVATIIYQSGTAEFPVEVRAQNVGIPVMGIGATDGATLKNLARDGVNVTLDPALEAVDTTANILWSQSARGPAVGTLAIKPEITAPGTDIYTATQKLDPNGDAYHASGYTSVTGTSFAVAFAAGGAALVKQKHPSMGPAQLKSALVNTALQDVTDEDGLARVVDTGAGRLNVEAAVTTAATVEPATLSFGSISTATLPVRLTLTVTNVSNASATFALSVNPRTSGSSASLSLSPTSLTLAAGQQNTVTVTLQGSRPSAGMYEGFVDIAGGGSTLHVPYLYLVGDGVVSELVPVRGVGFTGYVDDIGWLIGIRALDRFGVPVLRAPVTWRVTAGGGKFNTDRTGQQLFDPTTTNNGLALASVNFGSQAGDQTFTATSGGKTMLFDGFARPLPGISSGGVLNAASNDTADGKLAAGSYISIYGGNLADTTAIATTASLPYSLAQTAVRFESGGLILPGRLHFVSPGQINAQIPWEFEGRSSVEVKVSLPNITPWTYATYSLPLGSSAPGVFTRAGVAAALDANFKIVDASNPARRGQAVQIYANGLGPVDHTPATGEPTSAEQLSRTRVNASVTVGGRPAEVLFSGLAPGNVGLYQVNLVVAADTPTGSQPVVVTIGGVSSKPVNMPVQ